MDESNAKERLNQLIDDYDNDHNVWLRETMYYFGNRLKRMNNPIGRFIVSNITTRIMAYLFVEHGLFGVEKKEDMTLEEIAMNWLKPSIFFRVPTEIGEVTDEKIEVLRPECTVGFNDEKYCQLCRASMNMDLEIVRQLGGKLTVTETILEGASMCRHIIEKA